MSITKDEIIKKFAFNIEAAEEYNKPMEMTEEQYRELGRGNVGVSGESEWESPKSPKPLQPEWVEQWKAKPGEIQTGEEEWYSPQTEYDFEEEMVRRHERDVPSPEDVLEYRYHPEEEPFKGKWHPERRPEYLKRREKQREEKLTEPQKPETEVSEKPKQEYSDEEYFKMVAEEPEHVVTNLMLHRKAPYNQPEYIMPLAKSLTNWLAEIGYTPEEGTILYEEINHMLDTLEEELNRRESKKS